MKEEKIREIVYRNYEEGFHCAETILNTITELIPENSGNSCKAASGFCGGIGGCKADVCGALSGGVIALGMAYGRQKGNQDNSKLVFLSAEFRKGFIQKFNTTVCKKVIENMEHITDINSCKELTTYASILLYNLINEHP